MVFAGPLAGRLREVLPHMETYIILYLALYQGWKLALVHRPIAGKFDVGSVEILSVLVKCPITSIQMGYGEQKL